MAKAKKNIKNKKETASSGSNRQTPLSPTLAGNTKKLIYGIIIILTFIVYGNTINNQYALDDAIVITQNDFTKQGIEGIDDILSTELFTGFFGRQKNLVAGGRYRPLSVITFALEYEFFGQNPAISHFINILLFAITGIILFNILFILLSKYHTSKWYFSIPFIATILFIVHPLHTEVVSNIKGRDEIFTLIGSLIALLVSLKYLNTKKIKYLLISFLVFFLALISKENAITFFAIIPVSIFFFTDYKLKENLITLVPLVFATIIFFIIRQSILGNPSTDIPQELMNNSFLHHSFSEKYASITYTLGYYIILLFFPLHLTFDYYPYMIPILNWSNPGVIISLLVNGLLAFIFFKGFKKRSVISYGIFFYAPTFSIVSNIVFPIGTFMSERFMYIPSIGFVIIIAYILVVKLPQWIKNKKIQSALSYTLLAAMIVFYSGRTIARNIDWKNDFTLFTADVKVSSTSAKSNTSAGGKLGEEAEKLKKIQQKEFKSIDQLKGYLEDSTFLRNSDINEIIGNGNLKEALNQNIDKKVDEFYKLSIHYLEEAVKIHPTYADALLLLGNAYFQYNKDIDKSFEYYKRILKRNPMYEKVYTNMLIITANYDNLQHKIEMLEELNSINPNRYDLNYRLGLLYGENKIDLKKALNYLEKAITIKPDSFEAYKALGAGYGELGDFEKSIQYSSKASQLKPNDQQLKINLGITYKFYGAKIFNEQHDYKKALEYFLEGVKLLPNDPQLLQNIGLTYQQLGNMQKANEYYSKIKNLQTQPTTSN